VETGRVVNRRYLLQRLLKQGQYSAVYVGTDQVLQRPVTVKVVPAPYIQDYRAAIKLTAQFSQSNIIGLYDLVIETDVLYVVQEYVEGDDFATLLQKALSVFEVIELGSQMCQSLMYASASAYRVSHGDLTPNAVIRDRSGLARVNNFALPSDHIYFQKWGIMGGDDVAVSDTDLPFGTLSEGRQGDDTRAIGLLLYQLLASRAPGAGTVEPRPDGRLSFQRNIPPELCETVARAVVRRHPRAISTPEELFAELKTLSDTLMLEASALASTPGTSGYMHDETIAARPPAPTVGPKLATALPMRDIDAPGGVSPYQSGQSLKLPVAEPAPSAPTVADASLKLAAARRAAYPEPKPLNQGRSSLIMILLICLIAFAALFVIGYFIGQLLIK
jgi:serine/threonine protein kinase